MTTTLDRGEALAITASFTEQDWTAVQRQIDAEDERFSDSSYSPATLRWMADVYEAQDALNMRGDGESPDRPWREYATDAAVRAIVELRELAGDDDV